MIRTFQSAVAALFVAALSLSTVGPASAAVEPASEMIVLHVEGAPLKRGQVIDGTSPLKLESGWTVTLASSKGEFVTLKGPSHSIPLNGKDSRPGQHQIIETLSALLRAEKNSTAVLGVVRSSSSQAEVEPPVPWATSVEYSGTRCIKSDVVLLWRHDRRGEARLSINRNNSAQTAHVVWPAGQEYLSVKSSSFRDGETYTFNMKGRSVELRMRVMPAEHSSSVEQAAWMTRAGCRDQAVALIETIR